ncbi:MAG: hypothetical protein WC413_01485 [Candidatus Nanoarchaeia archaeon]
MKNYKLVSISFFLAALIIMLPICLAEEIKTTDGVILKDSNSAKSASPQRQANSFVNLFPGLSAVIVAIISPFVTAIAVAAAVIVGGYVVYRIGYSTWIYYQAYSYSNLIEYKHINDFPNIWSSSPPTKTQFKNECKKNMNSKSVERYIQVRDGRSVAYNPSTRMLTIGDKNGKDIITCFPKSRSDVNKEVSRGNWKRIR